MKGLYWFLAVVSTVGGLYFLQLFVMNVWLSGTPSPEDLTTLKSRAYLTLGISVLLFAATALLIFLGKRARKK